MFHLLITVNITPGSLIQSIILHHISLQFELIILYSLLHLGPPRSQPYPFSEIWDSRTEIKITVICDMMLCSLVDICQTTRRQPRVSSILFRDFNQTIIQGSHIAHGYIFAYPIQPAFNIKYQLLSIYEFVMLFLLYLSYIELFLRYFLLKLPRSVFFLSMTQQSFIPIRNINLGKIKCRRNEVQETVAGPTI
jgi:hypothetical protein